MKKKDDGELNRLRSRREESLIDFKRLCFTRGETELNTRRQIGSDLEQCFGRAYDLVRV